MEELVKKTIANATKEVLANYPYMDSFLESGCANFSALAEKIKPQVENILNKKNVNKEAIIMSIIRYSRELKTDDIPAVLIKSFAKSTLTLKTDMMYLNIKKTVHNLKILEDMYQNVDWEKGELFFIVQGIGEILVVLERVKYEILKTKIDANDVELEFTETAIIMMRSPEEIAEAGGLLHTIKPIAEARIQIEIITMLRDTVILVEEKNASKLFDILKNLIDKSRQL